MLKNDGSIDKIEEDKLNRKDFIERIIEGILGYKDTDSLVIGLEGNWGSGKTSILNIIEKELENKKINVFKFNPWNFSIRKQLVSDFFEQFSLFVGSRSNVKEALKEVSKSLMKISYILKPITTIAGVVPIVGNITKGVEELGNSYEKISNTIDLESIKKGVEKALGDGDEKIIIFIDDLDRLLDSEICEVLQFVKGIGDLKNIIYILAYDKQIVINSLDKVTSNKGEEYLKKIVQIQMELPIITSTKIGFLFKDEIEKLFKKQISKMSEDELEYLCEVFEEILIHLPKTMRDLKRIMNNIRFGLNKCEHLNIVDYIFIKTLEVTNYNVYKYIKNNKNNLVVSTKVRLEEIKDLEEFHKEDKDLMKKILGIIFEKRRINIPTNKEMEYYIPKRICNDAYFYDYFGEEFEVKTISKNIQNEMMSINTEEEFVKFLSTVKKLETITEIILNTSEFIFYKESAKTRCVYLLNLLERYTIKNEKSFDNVIILKNQIKKLLEEDNLNLLDLNKLEMKGFVSINLLLNSCKNRKMREGLLKKYISKTLKKDDLILEYINNLKKNIKSFEEEYYYLSIIYEMENGRFIIKENKKEILEIKDKIKKAITQESYNIDLNNLKGILKILEEEY
ncbi:KAP family NTPase (plasmid) [Cetobacterium somerae]|uniref:KAP family P-loop NTPase fold protein n=1 Tax=Cetobacterium somerae TaxID=188913 RepID=UPI001F05132C|nr:P-loop NTPase fold protein [Cetobacterium somerae]UPO98415.1 KAP family NTPase [Cetobacterium somerae]